MAQLVAPRIGIISRFDVNRNRYACEPAYVRAIEAAGGLPVLVPYLRSPSSVDEVLGMLDGILLTGGPDFDPNLYKGAMHPSIGPIIKERDDFEFPLVRAVLERDLPVLGICRGLQCLNVAAGGSLHSDLPSSMPTALNHQDPSRRAAHAVSIEPGTRLRAICHASELAVNSRHHQAVKDIGTCFRATAFATDGVVEAIESTTHRFAIGVQWHPEDLWESDLACRRLFEELVIAAAEARGRERRTCVER